MNLPRGEKRRVSDLVEIFLRFVGPNKAYKLLNTFFIEQYSFLKLREVTYVITRRRKLAILSGIGKTIGRIWAEEM